MSMISMETKTFFAKKTFITVYLGAKAKPNKFSVDVKRQKMSNNVKLLSGENAKKKAF